MDVSGALPLAKKTVDASQPPLASSLVYHVQVGWFFFFSFFVGLTRFKGVPSRFTPQPGRTFFDGTTKELVTMSETELVRYGKGEAVRIPIQNRNKPVKFCVFSPQHEYICIQRSDTEIEFTIVAKVRTFIKQVRRPKDSRILGIHWTFRNNLIVVTTLTVELYQVDEGGQLKLLKYYNVDVNFYKYAARNKILLVATGTTSSSLWSFVFKEDLVFRIPRFDLPFAVKSERQVLLSQVYSNVYVMVVDSGAGLLRLYTLSKDSIKPGVNLNLNSKAAVAINVVDNLIAVHNLDAKVTFLFDLQWTDAFPLAGPLPMVEAMATTGSNGVSLNPSVDLYDAKTCVYLMPNVILNETIGCLWTLDVRVDDVVKAVSASDAIVVLQFLVRRARSKPLILDHLKKMIGGGAPLRVVAQCFEVLNDVVASLPTRVQKELIVMSPVRVSGERADSAEENEAGGFVARRTTRGHMILDQRDMYADVFTAVLEREEARNDRYLVAVLVEYVRSLTKHKIEVEHFLFELLIGILVKNKMFVQLQQLLQYHVIEDSLPVAFQLLSIAKSESEASHQLALDMLRRLQKFDVIVDILLTRGEVLSALRFLESLDKKHLPSLDAKRFLDASIEKPMTFFTVFRFFEARGYSAPPEYVQKFSKHFAIGVQ